MGGSEEEVCLHTQGCHSRKQLERSERNRIWDRILAWGCRRGSIITLMPLMVTL